MKNIEKNVSSVEKRVSEKIMIIIKLRYKVGRESQFNQKGGKT